jgi:glucose dehydrogenase
MEERRDKDIILAESRDSMSLNPRHVTTHPSLHEFLRTRVAEVTGRIEQARTYDNQRFSPLKQVTADNVKGLYPAALIQTGMTASFDTTRSSSTG